MVRHTLSVLSEVRARQILSDTDGLERVITAFGEAVDLVEAVSSHEVNKSPAPVLAADPTP